MADSGIDPGRIEFTTHRRRGEYLRIYDRIDICLDPLIYNGITTTCDALWMGVPVITRIGPTAPGRAGLSILSNLNLPELIAHDDAHFVSIATELAGDFPRRSRLRASLRRSNAPISLDGCPSIRPKRRGRVPDHALIDCHA